MRWTRRHAQAGAGGNTVRSTSGRSITCAGAAERTVRLRPVSFAKPVHRALCGYCAPDYGRGGLHQGHGGAGGRATAYVLDSLVTAWQINGSIATNDQRQIQRLVDAILGEFDQQVNNDPYSNNYHSITHPQTYSYGIINRSYMLGLSMDALIEYCAIESARKDHERHHVSHNELRKRMRSGGKRASVSGDEVHGNRHTLPVTTHG